MGYARELEQACRLGSDPNSLPDRPDGFKDPASGCSMTDFGPTPVGSASLATSGYPVIRTVSCQAATGQARSYPNVGYPLGRLKADRPVPSDLAPPSGARFSELATTSRYAASRMASTVVVRRRNCNRR